MTQDSFKDNKSGIFKDIAIGLGIHALDIELFYKSLSVQGRIQEMDIRQLAGWGMPIYRELSNVLKVGINEVNDYASSGKIDISHIELAFFNMTSIEGVFHGIAEARSKSFFRLWR